MSVTFSVIDGRRQVRSQVRVPRRRSFSRDRSSRSQHYSRYKTSPSPRRYSSRESSSAWSHGRNDRRNSYSRSPPNRMLPSPPRLQIVIPNDTVIGDDDDDRTSPELTNGARPTILLMSKKFQNDPNLESARPQLASKKFRLTTDDGERSAPSSISDDRRLPKSESSFIAASATNGDAVHTNPTANEQRDFEPNPEPKPIVSSRSRFRALEAYPELFGNGSNPGVLLVQNLPLDVTGQEIVMKVFPEHDILAADLYESDDRKPYAEILFPRVQDAVGALQRHMGQIYRGHSLKITLLSSYKV